MDRIHLDYTNVLADVVGPEHGLTEEELAGMSESCAEALAAVQARRKRDLRWMDLPYQTEVHDAILAYADETLGRFENIVVLGIGGSALGNRALHTALSSPYHDLVGPAGHPRLFVLDNVDPDLVGEFLDTIDPTTCLFNVISKSGSTAETMSQFLIFRQELIQRIGEEAARDHIVVTTDAEKGVLRPIVEEEGYRSFVVPDGVGGRFSVLAPVGLLSSALVGIDIKGILAGAAAMDERCKNSDLFENPALLYAAVQWAMQTRKSKPMAITFAYSHRLRDLA
ncbi:MAG: glucose-6-phosphate isomerase, partial [Planctomycetota bacterium]